MGFQKIIPYKNLRDGAGVYIGISWYWTAGGMVMKSKKISNDQELIQSDPLSCPQNQKGNN